MSIIFERLEENLEEESLKSCLSLAWSCRSAMVAWQEWLDASTSTLGCAARRLAAYAKAGSTRACRQLLQKQIAGTRVPACNNSSEALRAAAANGRTAVCELLLTWRNKPARANASNSLALAFAAKYGHLDTCRLLLQQPHHAARADGGGLYLLAGFSLADELSKAPLSATATRDCGAFYLAAANGHLEVCHLLLNWPEHAPVADAADGTDKVLNDARFWYTRALKHAAAKGHLGGCQLLVDWQHKPRRAGVDAHNDALVVAARHGQLEVCQLLLGLPDQAARADARRSLALWAAMRGGHAAVCDLLLQWPQHPARQHDLNTTQEREQQAQLDLLLSGL